MVNFKSNNILKKKYTQNVSLDLGTTAGKIFKFIGENKNVLEIGCASGVQSQVMKELLNCRIYGVEIDPEAAAQAAQFCEKVIVGNVEHLDLVDHIGDEVFDVVVCADVLEHLVDPAGTLKSLIRFLKPDGILVASVPNIVHASVVYQMAKGVFDYTEFGLLDDSHVRFFTKKTICETLIRAGFIVDKLETISCDPRKTELNIVVETRREKRLLHYILKNNSESLAYQYVLKAIIGPG